LWALAEKAVHDALGVDGEAARPVLREIVAGALPGSGGRVEGREDVEGDEHGPLLHQLAVVAAALGGQDVLELPGATDTGVVMGVARPARTVPACHRGPQAGEP